MSNQSSSYPHFWPAALNTDRQQLALVRQMDESLRLIAGKQPSNSNSNNLGSVLNGITNEIHYSADQIRQAIDGLSATFSWNLGMIHDELMEQTKILEEIARVMKQPAETEAKEFLHSGQELAEKWVNDTKTGILTTKETNVLFKNIEKKYQLAMNADPSGPLTYLILIAQAELYLLNQGYAKAAKFFEESISFAPSSPTFHYLSYPTRVLGRIAFISGDTEKAVDYLRRSVTASPNYDIGWYEYAQYQAVKGSKDEAMTALKQALQLDQKYWYLMCDEENFDNIRKEVTKLHQEIPEKMKAECLKCAKPLLASTQAVYDILTSHNYKVLMLASKEAERQRFSNDVKIVWQCSRHDQIKADHISAVRYYNSIESIDRPINVPGWKNEICGYIQKESLHRAELEKYIDVFPGAIKNAIETIIPKEIKDYEKNRKRLMRMASSKEDTYQAQCREGCFSAIYCFGDAIFNFRSYFPSRDAMEEEQKRLVYSANSMYDLIYKLETDIDTFTDIYNQLEGVEKIGYEAIEPPKPIEHQVASTSEVVEETEEDDYDSQIKALFTPKMIILGILIIIASAYATIYIVNLFRNGF
jgi:tetratricopeptide (TPR) repeat protein